MNVQLVSGGKTVKSSDNIA